MHTAPSEPWGSDLITFCYCAPSICSSPPWVAGCAHSSRRGAGRAGRRLSAAAPRQTLPCCFPYGSGEEAGGEESSIPTDDLGTLATGGCYVAERGSEHLGLRQRPPLRCRVSYRDVTGRTRWLRSSPLIARPSPNLSLDRDPEGPRPSARRHWRCTSIAAGPTLASSSGRRDRAAR
jgi:hypothetical protein